MTCVSSHAIRTSLLAAGVVLSAGCGSTRPRTTSPAARSALAVRESLYREVRDLRDEIDVTRARGADASVEGASLAELLRRYRERRTRLVGSLASLSGASLAGPDARAFAVMRHALATGLDAEEGPPSADNGRELDCAYDAEALARSPGGLRALRERVYACYGAAARAIVFEGDTLDRLTILGLLGRTDDPERRRRLFMALGPVWLSVNGDNGRRSPFRQMVQLDAPAWRSNRSPVEIGLRQLGIAPQEMERWLISILERWRDITPAGMIEPWDFYYAAGEASRRLSPRIPRDDLMVLNDRYFRALGADPTALRIHYDLDPRPGKTPVAFTTFGARGGLRNGQWEPTEAWVFATYRVGGLDNLSELLHETGHGVHIAAIRTRPAFEDWPDSDPWSEALGDFVALEIYEPAWQLHFLGDSVPLARSLRAKYAGIVLDIAWALFEVRMRRTPTSDPNQLWTAITRQYLKIAPHPELSWWAMRGQLVDAPGYMMNYAVGAILIADVRARAKAEHRAFTLGDTTWYPWVSEHLYRFGLERPSREVIADFLGRRVTPRALLTDLDRMKN
jgi:hypothetical protein